MAKALDHAPATRGELLAPPRRAHALDARGQVLCEFIEPDLRRERMRVLRRKHPAIRHIAAREARAIEPVRHAGIAMPFADGQCFAVMAAYSCS